MTESAIICTVSDGCSTVGMDGWDWVGAPGRSKFRCNKVWWPLFCCCDAYPLIQLVISTTEIHSLVVDQVSFEAPVPDFWSLISISGKTFQSRPQQRSSVFMDCGRWKIVEKDSRTRYQPDAIYRGSQKTVSSSNSRENSWTCHCCRSSLPSFMCTVQFNTSSRLNFPTKQQ